MPLQPRNEEISHFVCKIEQQLQIDGQLVVTVEIDMGSSLEKELHCDTSLTTFYIVRDIRKELLVLFFKRFSRIALAGFHFDKVDLNVIAGIAVMDFDGLWRV